jgi:hypothetical protein
MTSITQNASPVDVVKAFIACVQTKDVDSMRKCIHPEATACLIRGNEPNFKPLTEAIDALAQAEQELVEIIWDEVEHVDGKYAAVWASFSIHLDGEASSPFPYSGVRFLLIHATASPTGIELVLVLVQPSLPLDHPDDVRRCKITQEVKQRKSCVRQQRQYGR